jgi:hypothetical protein
MSLQSSSPDLTNKPEQPSAAEVGEDALYYRRVLRHLVEIGDEFAELVREEARQLVRCQAEAAKRYSDPQTAPAPSLPPDLVDAYERITRSMRRTIMLAEKLAQPTKATSSQHRIAARKRIIRDVEDAIHNNAPPGEEEKLHAEFLERLDSPDLEDEIANRTVPDIVQDICRDLGVAGLYDEHPWKRRVPHDIATLCARAAASSLKQPPPTPSAAVSTGSPTGSHPPAQPP